VVKTRKWQQKGLNMLTTNDTTTLRAMMYCLLQRMERSERRKERRKKQRRKVGKKEGR
jgi:hypothetical protein